METSSVCPVPSTAILTNSPIIAKEDSGVVHWYPMRYFHSSAKRQLELKEELDKERVVEETYVPLKLIDAEANRFALALQYFLN